VDTQGAGINRHEVENEREDVEDVDTHKRCEAKSGCPRSWIEKSVLLAGGFVPSRSGAIGAYVPGLAVVSTTAGIWAAGLLIVTIFYIIILAFRT